MLFAFAAGASAVWLQAVIKAAATTQSESKNFFIILAI
jgi:hypothetical protein